MRGGWRASSLDRLALGSQLPTPTVSLPTPTRSATRRRFQSNADKTESRTSMGPASRSTRRSPDTVSRTDSDAIGGRESLAVTDP